jgi:hypothetical protein
MENAFSSSASIVGRCLGKVITKPLHSNGRLLGHHYYDLQESWHNIFLNCANRNQQQKQIPLPWTKSAMVRRTYY